MPTPHAREGLDRQQSVDRRAVAMGVFLFGLVLVLAPTVLWPPATATDASLHVETVEGGGATDPTPYGDLPRAARRAFDAARQGTGSTVLENDVLRRVIRQHPYVSHEGTTFRLGVYAGEQTALGVALFGPVVVAVGAAAMVVGGLVDRRRTFRPLTPMRGLLVPLGAFAALWISPSTGGFLGVPPALGLAVPLGSLLVPVGCLCRGAGKRYVVLGPLVGLATGVAVALVLGAEPARYDAILASVAVVALPWYGLGAILSKPDGAGR